jgi:hypothetical protein
MNCRRFKLILVLTLVIASFPSTIFAAQAKIQGDYCYQYGDSESLMVAKEISYAMALRKAIETYKTFVASTSVVKDFKLRKDLVETIASGYVENIRIIKQDVKGRNVCTELVGYVNSDVVKSVIARKVERVKRPRRTPHQGIVGNKQLKILNYTKHGSRVKLTYQAERRIGTHSCGHICNERYAKIIVHCFDRNGDPIEGRSIYVPKEWEQISPGEVRTAEIFLPQEAVSFELALD